MQKVNKILQQLRQSKFPANCVIHIKNRIIYVEVETDSNELVLLLSLDLPLHVVKKVQKIEHQKYPKGVFYYA